MKRSNSFCGLGLALVKGLVEYRIEVIDLLKNPTLARGDQILAIPTLDISDLKKTATPCRRTWSELQRQGSSGTSQSRQA